MMLDNCLLGEDFVTNSTSCDTYGIVGFHFHRGELHLTIRNYHFPQHNKYHNFVHLEFSNKKVSTVFETFPILFALQLSSTLSISGTLSVPNDNKDCNLERLQPFLQSVTVFVLQTMFLSSGDKQYLMERIKSIESKQKLMSKKK